MAIRGFELRCGRFDSLSDAGIVGPGEARRGWLKAFDQSLRHGNLLIAQRTVRKVAGDGGTVWKPWNHSEGTILIAQRTVWKVAGDGGTVWKPWSHSVGPACGVRSCMQA